ncbi:MAG: hypothetical protein KJ063_13810 [Anaerolineae bacterium]|nr:hypothetical protein [Anaerolineae bacterium]
MKKQRVWIILGSGLGTLLLAGWLWAMVARPHPLSASPDNNSPALAQDMRYQGHISGLANAVFISSTHLYAGLGAELAILDVSTPASPTRLGYAPLPGLVTDVTVIGPIAYVAAAESGLHLFNIQNPATPTYLSTYTVTGQLQAVTVQGHIAYLAETFTAAPFGRITSLDITNPTSPTVQHTLNLGVPAYNLVASGSLLYVAADFGGLRILNISNPAQITPLSSLVTPGWARGVAVQNNYAYVIQTNCTGECNGYLSIINITDPANPTANSHTLLPGSGANLVVVGDYAYLADRNGGFRIMQISNPNAPVLAGSIITPGTAWDVAWHNNQAYIADAQGGIRLYNVSNPASIALLGSYEVTNHALDVTLYGSTAYVSDWSGVAVYDVTDPALPLWQNRLPLPNIAEHLAIRGQYGYVAQGSAGIRILDLSNPAAPVVVGSYNTTGVVHRILIDGHLAYVADGNKGLLILDLSNPVAPTQVGFWDTPGEAWDVALRGNLAFVADGTQGIRVIDVSSPAAPVEVGFVVLFGQAVGIVLYGDVAYVAALNGNLLVIDIAQPTAPTQIRMITVGGWVYRLAVQNDVLFAAASIQGVRLFHLQDPANPVETAYLRTGGTARSITLSGDTAYVADMSGGVALVQEAYRISGRVADHAGVPQAGVLLQASNGLTATTDISGTFTLAGFLYGSYLITPTLPDFVFTPTHRVVGVGPSVAGEAFVSLPAPVTVALTPGAAATLIYTDVQGLPTRFTFPIGSVTTPSTIVVTPTLLTLDHPSLRTIGHNFDLAVYQGSTLMPNFLFNNRIQVMIQYSEIDLGPLQNEEGMFLGRWQGGAWVDAAATCTPTSIYTHNQVTNQITISICRSGSFALLVPVHTVYLPLMAR